MPRKGPAEKSPVVADPVYNSPVVTALINKVLNHGSATTGDFSAGPLRGITSSPS